VEDHIASGKRSFNRGRIAQIALDGLGSSFANKIGNVAQIACRTHEEAQIGSLFGQHARNMTAQESSGAGDESFHDSAVSSWLLALS
jgi:hypothetical protein